MAVAKHRIENFRRENMLNEHFLNIKSGDVGIDTLLTQLPEHGISALKMLIPGSLFGHELAQGLHDIGDVLFELCDGLTEQRDFRAFVFDKRT